MSTIRCIFHPNVDGSRRDPGFPATDQHPQAVRYAVDHPLRGALNVDAVGEAPTLAEVDVALNLDAAAPDRKASGAVDAVDRLQFEVDFEIENRMRAREGQAAVTRVQYRNALIARWKALNP